MRCKHPGVGRLPVLCRINDRFDLIRVRLIGGRRVPPSICDGSEPWLSNCVNGEANPAYSIAPWRNVHELPFF